MKAKKAIAKIEAKAKIKGEKQKREMRKLMYLLIKQHIKQLPSCGLLQWLF